MPARTPERDGPSRGPSRGHSRTAALEGPHPAARTSRQEVQDGTTRVLGCHLAASGNGSTRAVPRPAPSRDRSAWHQGTGAGPAPSQGHPTPPRTPAQLSGLKRSPLKSGHPGCQQECGRSGTSLPGSALQTAPEPPQGKDPGTRDRPYGPEVPADADPPAPKKGRDLGPQGPRVPGKPLFRAAGGGSGGRGASFAHADQESCRDSACRGHSQAPRAGARHGHGPPSRHRRSGLGETRREGAAESVRRQDLLRPLRRQTPARDAGSPPPATRRPVASAAWGRLAAPGRAGGRAKMAPVLGEGPAGRRSVAWRGAAWRGRALPPGGPARGGEGKGREPRPGRTELTSPPHGGCSPGQCPRPAPRAPRPAPRARPGRSRLRLRPRPRVAAGLPEPRPAPPCQLPPAGAGPRRPNQRPRRPGHAPRCPATPLPAATAVAGR